MVKKKGYAKAAQNVKESLEDWRRLHDVLEKKGASEKEITRKWVKLQESSTRALFVLRLLFFVNIGLTACYNIQGKSC